MHVCTFMEVWLWRNRYWELFWLLFVLLDSYSDICHIGRHEETAIIFMSMFPFSELGTHFEIKDYTLKWDKISDLKQPKWFEEDSLLMIV